MLLEQAPATAGKLLFPPWMKRCLNGSFRGGSAAAAPVSLSLHCKQTKAQPPSDTRAQNQGTLRTLSQAAAMEHLPQGERQPWILLGQRGLDGTPAAPCVLQRALRGNCKTGSTVQTHRWHRKGMRWANTAGTRRVRQENQKIVTGTEQELERKVIEEENNNGREGKMKPTGTKTHRN